jgi:hypothetical protein
MWAESDGSSGARFSFTLPKPIATNVPPPAVREESLT